MTDTGYHGFEVFEFAEFTERAEEGESGEATRSLRLAQPTAFSPKVTAPISIPQRFTALPSREPGTLDFS